MWLRTSRPSRRLSRPGRQCDRWGRNSGPAADLPTATVVAAVAAGDASKQTLVTMTNDSVRLKLCKYVDQGLTTDGPREQPFPFKFAASGNAGPNGPIAPCV